MTGLYGSRRGKKNPLPTSAGQPTPSPIVDGKTIVWKRDKIPAEQVWNLCVKSKYNPRLEKFITKESLGTMLDEIEASGRNTYEVYAYKDSNGKLHILAGMRRSTAVSLVPGATLHILYSEDLTDAEQQHYAEVSDRYKEPSLYEYGIRLKELESEQGKKLTQREAAKLFRKSLGTMNEIYKRLQVPEAVYHAIGHPDYLSKEGVAEVIKYIKSRGEQYVVDRIQALELQPHENFESEDKFKAHVTNAIADALKEEAKVHRVAPPLSKVWDKGIPKKADVKRSKRGELIIKLPEEVLNTELEDALLKALSANIK